MSYEILQNYWPSFTANSPVDRNASALTWVATRLTISYASWYSWTFKLAIFLRPSEPKPLPYWIPCKFDLVYTDSNSDGRLHLLVSVPLFGGDVWPTQSRRYYQCIAVSIILCATMPNPLLILLSLAIIDIISARSLSRRSCIGWIRYSFEQKTPVSRNYWRFFRHCCIPLPSHQRGFHE